MEKQNDQLNQLKKYRILSHIFSIVELLFFVIGITLIVFKFKGYNTLAVAIILIIVDIIFFLFIPFKQKYKTLRRRICKKCKSSLENCHYNAEEAPFYSVIPLLHNPCISPHKHSGEVTISTRLIVNCKCPVCGKINSHSWRYDLNRKFNVANIQPDVLDNKKMLIEVLDNRWIDWQQYYSIREEDFKEYMKENYNDCHEHGAGQFD